MALLYHTAPPTAAGYTQIIRQRAGCAGASCSNRGQTAGAITQTGSACASCSTAARIAAIMPGEPDHGMNLRLCEFYWQDLEVTRAIRKQNRP